MARLTGPVTTAVVAASLWLGGCQEDAPVSAKVMPVKIGGETFHLEVAATEEVRTKGLGQRTHIEDDGGMIFVFPPSRVVVQTFVMRDCPMDIDILYLDGAGRVMTTYTMKAEEPRKPDEGTVGDFNNEAYEKRLKKYSSRFPSPIVVELKAGTIDRLNVKEGDVLEFDAAGLKKMAR